MKVLILYPHGLGDCILATPALRQYKLSTGNHVGFAMLQRFASSELFTNNPYIDELFFTKDAWNDFPNFNIGMVELENHCKKLAKEHGYDRVVTIKHSPKGSKILDCANVLGVELDDVHTEIYTTEEDRQRADEFLGENSLDKFGFVHSKTGVKNKDLPNNYGREWIKTNTGLNDCVEVGVEFRYNEFNINVQFEIMRQAAAVCVADSVFYHALCAMDKKVDLVYFARGAGIWNRVKHLHKVDEKVVWKL